MAKKNDRPACQEEMPLTRKVSRMGRLIHRYYATRARRRGGMGDPLRGQGRILTLLKAKPETTQRELSYLLDIRQQSLSEMLAKLEEKGFVTREKSPEDGRVSIVRLTEAGSLAAPAPDQIHAHDDALSELTDEERAQLETLTDKACTSLEGKLEELGVDPNRGPLGRRGPHGPRGPHGRRGPYRPHTPDTHETHHA